MSEYKPITIELRLMLADINWTEIIDHMQTSSGAVVDGDWLDHWHEHAEHICDNIDSIHANLERENERLRECDGWVELPKDADGEYIHFGDVLDQFGTPMTVFAMSDPDPDQGDCMLELITDGISDDMWVRARKMRHYHAPTVEDVLREMLDAWGELPSNETNDAIVAEYAKRLTLAGDAE